MPAKISVLAAKQLIKKIPLIGQVGLSVVPFSIKAKAIVEILNILMKEQMQDGELDFLQERWVRIEVTDFNLRFEVSYENKWLIRELQDADVSFSADSRALIKVAAAKEDPDALFFQRQLKIEGDTELGLEVKNLLLSIELDEIPKTIRIAVDKLAFAVEVLETKSAQAI